jgi:hypothetical protein
MLASEREIIEQHAADLAESLASRARKPTVS